MNVAAPGLAITSMLSMKREMKLIFGVFGLVALLPVMFVLMLAQLGIDAVSGALVSGDPQSLVINIHDPATGEVVDQLVGTALWPVSGTVTAEFGVAHLPIQPLHTGIDIAGPTGDPVVSFFPGTVTYADETSWGFGKHVVVNHGHHVTSTYAHFDSILAQKGQIVEAGTILGTRGDTGWSTGPHLHFEIRVFGIPANPRSFLAGDP